MDIAHGYIKRFQYGRYDVVEPTIGHKRVLHHLKNAGCKKISNVHVPYDQIVKRLMDFCLRIVIRT
ncbi:hypothetical protein V1477_003421 [Vespula maculifrons]|uniref:Uncharacterized protein n=1 Tax=Vespula maculifrons TaxID=7453 RepID=A0ABD2CUH0_VESMC